MKIAFKMFDKNGDGFSSHNELKLLMMKLGEKLTGIKIQKETD